MNPAGLELWQIMSASDASARCSQQSSTLQAEKQKALLDPRSRQKLPHARKMPD